MNEIVKGRKNR